MEYLAFIIARVRENYILLKRMPIKSSIMVKLLRGELVGQLLPILTYPLLARIYSPGDFGAFALFSSVCSLIAIAVTGRYELAILLPKSDRNSFQLLRLTLLLASIGGFLVFGIIQLLKIAQIVSYSFGEMAPLVSIFVIVLGWYQGITYWAMRCNKYAGIAAARIIQAVTTAGFSIMLGGQGFRGLVYGLVLGYGVSLIFLGIKILHKSPPLFWPLNIKRKVALAAKYISFPQVNLPQTFLENLQGSGVFFLVGMFFGTNTLGFYSLATRAIQAPLGPLRVAFEQFYYRRFAELSHERKSLGGTIDAMIIRLLVIASPFVLGILFFAPHLFSFFLGPTWIEAGKYAQILTPWMLMNFIASPLLAVPIVINQQRRSFFVRSMYSVAIISPVIIIGTLSLHFIYVLWGMAFSTSLALGYYVIWVRKTTYMSA